MDGFKHERTLQKKTQVPECPSEPIDAKPTTNALVKRRKEDRIGFLLLTRNAYLQIGVFVCSFFRHEIHILCPALPDEYMDEILV
ncbi:unnamed protein product [Sphagnum compactum]